MGNLGAQKEKRNDTPISAKKDIMGDKTVRVRADLHHIIKIETAKNGGNVKEVMEIRLRSKLKSVLILQYLKILCIIGIEVKFFMFSLKYILFLHFYAILKHYKNSIYNTR